MKKSEKIKETRKIDKVVFWPPFIAMILVVGLNFISEDTFVATANGVFGWITSYFNWVYVLIGFLCVIVSAATLFGKWGSIRIGGADAKPKYTYFQWFSMVLCGGIGIGIVFWGVAEPLQMFMAPANGIEAMSEEAAVWGMSATFVHWTIAPYAIYAIAAIPICLAVYNYKQKVTIGAGLYFAIGEKYSTGIIGKIADALCIFALVGGISGSMGQGLMQITSGLGYVSPIQPSNITWLVIAAIIIFLFTFSSAVGIDKGLNFVANQNVKLYAVVMVFIIVCGPASYIFQMLTESTGAYVQNFVELHTYMGLAHGQAGDEGWVNMWNVFWYAAFICYAPVMGIFLSRMGYGRTIREFVVVNLVLPAAFGFLWFAIFGATALDMQLSGTFDICGVMMEKGVESAVFEFFQQLPLGNLLIVVFLVVVVISFITCADSMTSSIAILSTKGFSMEDGEPPLYLKVVWGLLMGILAWIMICFAGVDGTKMIAIICTFPMLIIMALMMVSTIKGLMGKVYIPKSERIAVEGGEHHDK